MCFSRASWQRVGVTTELLGEPFERQWAALLWFLSHVSLVALPHKPMLGGPRGRPPLPRAGGALCAPTAPCQVRPFPSSLQTALAGCGSAGGTLSRCLASAIWGHLPLPGLLLRTPLKCDLGILSKSLHITGLLSKWRVKVQGEKDLKQKTP